MHKTCGTYPSTADFELRHILGLLDFDRYLQTPVQNEVRMRATQDSKKEMCARACACACELKVSHRDIDLKA